MEGLSCMERLSSMEGQPLHDLVHIFAVGMQAEADQVECIGRH